MVIKSADYIISCVDQNQYPKDNLPIILLLGRSNVGKSSFINTITNRKKLAYTSSKPGKTLTLNFYRINNQFYFVDTPGYGYASRSFDTRQNFGKMIENILSNNERLKKVFLIVDSRIEPTDDDLLMIEFLRHYNHNLKVVATKSDKLSKNEIFKNKNIIKNKLAITDDDLIIFSSLNKTGVADVDNEINNIL